MSGRRKIHAAGDKRAHACDTAAPNDDLDVTDDWGLVTCRLCLYRIANVRAAMSHVTPWSIEDDYSLSMVLDDAQVFIPDRVWNRYADAYYRACVDHARAVIAAADAGQSLPPPPSVRVR